jgi:Uncharacterized conserved protein
MAFFMACLTGLMAQIVIPLPWTPVPVTAQTFAVLISGILLGRYWGGFSQLLYVILGVAGIPWFAGMEGGYTIILGATGGYLIGFIIAALFLGHFVDKYIGSRNFIPMFALMLFANFILIYVPGLLALGFWVYTTKGYIPSLWDLLVMGLLPFIIGDIIKITGASALTKAITPKEAYGEEVDTKD